VTTPPAKAGGFSEEKFLALTAASQAKLGSLPKVLPTLAPEGPVRAAWQTTSLCAATPLTTLLPRVFYAQEVFPAQPREHPVLKVLDQYGGAALFTEERMRNTSVAAPLRDVPTASPSWAFLCQLKQAVPCPLR
jgi:hypothetical protein